jgi:hypothetical protein
MRSVSARRIAAASLRTAGGLDGAASAFFPELLQPHDDPQPSDVFAAVFVAGGGWGVHDVSRSSGGTTPTPPVFHGIGSTHA